MKRKSAQRKRHASRPAQVKNTSAKAAMAAAAVTFAEPVTVAEAAAMESPRFAEPVTLAERSAQELRTQLFTQVDLHTESNFFSGFSGDLSDGGLFVATYEALSPGQPVEVELSLPGGLFVSAKGRVAWLRQPPRGQDAIAPGAGIVFEELDETLQGAVAQFMAFREPTFVDPD